ncbi:MAG TPA: glycerophosphodiester phosphodiesterase family protein [Pseudonocardiaceae bacterium]|nr:glycerophosphodiester phosphodiesterase family protein [Pseudonocardiaceae bacterium]
MSRLPSGDLGGGPVSAPLIVAHRGASAQRAEHTLAAYALALEQGAAGLECDVRLTRDEHLVCVHDRRVDRTSTGRGPVSSQDLAALAAHDYGSWHDDLGDADDLIVQRVARRGPAESGLLTLERLLDLVTGWPDPVQLFIETKHPVRQSGLVERTLVALLARHGLATPRRRADSPVLVMSFSPSALRRIRTQAPALPTVALLSELDRVRCGRLPRWADLVGPDVRALRSDPGFVERAANQGHPTYCWTVDDPADVALCAELGVRYVATNRPAQTRALLRS